MRFKNNAEANQYEANNVYSQDDPTHIVLQIGGDYFFHDHVFSADFNPKVCSYYLLASSLMSFTSSTCLS